MFAVCVLYVSFVLRVVALYRRGLIYLEVPVADSDLIIGEQMTVKLLEREFG